MRSVFFLMVASTLAFSAVGCAASPEGDQTTDLGEANLTSAQERAKIMDALRAVVKPDVANQDIVFDVSRGHLNVSGGWAWLQGTVALRNGAEPSTAGTAYADDAREGLFDGWHIEALLKHDDGGWNVITHGIGSTDVWWWGIDESYPEAPKSIFPYLDTNVVAPAERVAIMDALRAVVKAEAGNQDIVFNVQGDGGRFNVKDGWCWLQGTVQLRNGRTPATAGTRYEESANEGLFDGWHIEALLKLEDGGWKVVTHGVGSTDVWWSGIADSYPDAPKVIFPEIAGGTAPN